MIGEKIDEPVELPTCVLTVVSALTALSFSLVRQEVLNDWSVPEVETGALNAWKM